MIATTRVRYGAALPSLALLRSPVVVMPQHMAVLMWRVTTTMGGKMRAETRLRLNAHEGRLSVDAGRTTPASHRLGLPSSNWPTWADVLIKRVKCLESKV